MPALNKVQIAWTGLRGAPGVSTFYFDDTASVPLVPLKTFFSSVAGILPPGLTLTFPSTGPKIESTTGMTVGTWSATPPTSLVGTGTGGYAAPVGMLVNWHTGVFGGGREIRGKTFIVPVTAASYESDGSAGNSWVTALKNAATALIGDAAVPMVFSRARHLAAPVTSATVPDKVVVMRSRRD